MCVSFCFCFLNNSIYNTTSEWLVFVRQRPRAGWWCVWPAEGTGGSQLANFFVWPQPPAAAHRASPPFRLLSSSSPCGCSSTRHWLGSGWKTTLNPGHSPGLERRHRSGASSLCSEREGLRFMYKRKGQWYIYKGVGLAFPPRRSQELAGS